MKLINDHILKLAHFLVRADAITKILEESWKLHKHNPERFITNTKAFVHQYILDNPSSLDLNKIKKIFLTLTDGEIELAFDKESRQWVPQLKKELVHEG